MIKRDFKTKIFKEFRGFVAMNALSMILNLNELTLSVLMLLLVDV